MKWEGRRQSSNIEDRRGRRVGSVVGGGGIGLVVMALVAMYFGVDPRVVLNIVGDLGGGGVQQQQQQPYQPSPEEQKLAEFTSVVLADTEDAWQRIFAEYGKRYEEPKLVLFSEAVQSACGYAQAAMGPFYCPDDGKVYIDLGFYRELKRRHNAPGDFAQAYVIAHEVGHHVQTLLGISEKVQQAQQSVGQTESNELSVRMELQADCFAGVWANKTHNAKHVLEEGDLEEALNAASAIGDDQLQREATGYVRPDSFTHGSSKQRVTWFKKGLTEGDINACNTFDNVPL